MTAILEILAAAAVRSLLLGALVLAFVKLGRLRDLAAETLVWTVVLAAALAMPLLSLWLPAVFALHLPAAVAPAQDLAVRAATTAPAHAALPPWPLLALGFYALVALVLTLRLIVGLLLTLRLYLRAEPVAEAWARGRAIRASTAIDGPLSLGWAILLPADYEAWTEAKRLAVLAHEESHVRRGDFFILLLASAHRALFWFSPFAWWVQARLGDLAETASDAAAARRLGDAAGYAEILVEVTRDARRPHGAPALAMARGPGIARRVDHILFGAPEAQVGRLGRLLLLIPVVSLTLGLAELRAAGAAAQTAPASSPSSSSPVEHPAPSPTARAGPVRPLARAAASPHAARVLVSRRRSVGPAVAAPPAAPAPSEEVVSYDPRALLQDPEAAVIPAIILAGHHTAVAQPDR